MANLIRGRDVFEPPRFMTVAQAAAQLVEIVEETRAKLKQLHTAQDDTDTDSGVSKEDAEIDELVQRHDVLDATSTLGVGLARVGRDDQRICVDTVERLSTMDLGPPLHSMVIAGRLHHIEVEFMRQFYDEKDIAFDSLVAAHNKFYE